MLNALGKRLFWQVAGLIALTVCGGASAKDAVMATVPTSIAYTVEENGNPLAAGTYAIGTLKVFMIVVGTQWPETLSPLPLDLAIRASNAKPYTAYPVPIQLRQVGGDLTLSPSPAAFEVAGTAWTGSSDIAISVPASIRSDADLNADGTELVGNLQIEATNTRSYLDTVTTLRIFAKLVHPTTCLRSATFVANTPLNRNLSNASSGLEFEYSWNRNNGSFSWSVTPNNNQIRDNVVVVNTCNTPQSYDVKIGLASGFQKTAPGNVVESYVSSIANADALPFLDPYTELKTANDAGSYAGSTAEGTGLCVTTNTLPGLYSQWLRAKVELVTTGFTSAAGIPNAGDAYQTFTSDLHANDSNCLVAHPSAGPQGTAVVYVKSKSCTPGGSKVCSAP